MGDLHESWEIEYRQLEKLRKNFGINFVELEGNFVIDWIHKNIRPEDFTIEDKFKTVNIHKLDKDFFENTFKAII